MTGPDRRVLLALDRRPGLDSDGLRRATQLAAPTLDVSLRKLVRMRLVTQDADGSIRLTARGRRRARELRTSE
ncbi:MAG TPA: hypothetical protein VLG28_03795 [Acidimicrobiia bacterium]|nr:hypothetical protein [Acidimicrobiia bacterium]